MKKDSLWEVTDSGANMFPKEEQYIVVRDPLINQERSNAPRRIYSSGEDAKVEAERLAGCHIGVSFYVAKLIMVSKTVSVETKFL